jgi:anion-transporting  ArsA/GET3 family ATPase
VLRGLGRFTGKEFLQNVGQFVNELNSLFGGFRERAKAVYDDMKGKDVAFVIVTSPSPLTVAEAIFFTRKLREYGIEPRAMVVNRVHALPELSNDRAPLAGELSAFVEARGLAAPSSLLPRMIVATEDVRTLARRDLSGLKRLRKSIGEQLAYVEVPEFDRDVHELGSLARLSGYLVGGRPVGGAVGGALDDSSADSVSIGAP